MGQFLTPLELEFIDGRNWKITAPFEYHLGAADGPETVRIPVGFVTDFASIPRGLWNIFPPAGRYGKAAVVHDWLYQKRVITLESTARLGSRLDADNALREGMQVLGVGSVTRWAIYAGVRAGGWVPWNNYRKAELK